MNGSVDAAPHKNVRILQFWLFKEDTRIVGAVTQKQDFMVTIGVLAIFWWLIADTKVAVLCKRGLK